jgi:hypothetical protein
MKYSLCALIILALVMCCSMPVTGVTTYLSEGPRMSAAISGTNEFSPGQDAVISVIVQNRGLNSIKFVMEGTIDREEVPTTAKMVTVGLLPGDAPVIVKTDPQNLGNLTSQKSATVRIAAKITSAATEGEYTLPLTIRYQYLAAATQEQGDVLESDYEWRSETIPLTIKIKPSVKIEVLEAVPENLSVGTGGYLNLTIKNAGFEDGKKATVRLIRNGNSPVIPTDSNVFIGDFLRNATVTCRYKVAISSEAENQTYPVDVVVAYENRDGDTVTSAPDTIGVPVLPKLTFAVISDPVSITAGSEQVITVRYQNTGAQTAYHAQARLSAVDPFTSADNSAYLGDLKPGESATASYRISTESGAQAQEYMLDTEVRFRDAHDNSQISDTFRVAVRLAPSSQPTGAVAVLQVIIPAVIAVGAGYYLLVMRKKK